jgi:hypothetical protein
LTGGGRRRRRERRNKHAKNIQGFIFKKGHCYTHPQSFRLAHEQFPPCFVMKPLLEWREIWDKFFYTVACYLLLKNILVEMNFMLGEKHEHFPARS